MMRKKLLMEQRAQRRDKYDFTWEGGSSRAELEEEQQVKLNPMLDVMSMGMDVFMRQNHIYFHAPVSKESVYQMSELILTLNDAFFALQAQHPDVEMTPKPIYLHIDSFGGGVFAAFAAIDFITQSALPVHTIVEGATASAGTLMSVVGKKRYIAPHASMLVHQLSSWFGGKLTEIDDEYQNLRQMHDMIKSIYIEHTTMADEDLESLLKHDLWWRPEKCLEAGLVDAIWDQRDHWPKLKSGL